MRKRGHSLVEAICGLIVIYALGVALTNIGVGLYAISLNNSVCRNAAEFAASGNPKESTQRANMILSQAGNGLGKLVSAPTLAAPIDVHIDSQPADRRDPDTDKIINPGGSITGSIIVKTQIELRPFGVDLILPQYKVMTFQSSQSFPIHYVRPPS